MLGFPVMVADIACEAHYPYPPAVVWRALVTPAALEAWLMATTFQYAEVGHRFRFTDRPRPFWNGICECEVIESDPEKLLTLRWGIGSSSTGSRVCFALTPTEDGGTHLAFRHSELHGLMGILMKKGMSKGWSRMVERSIPFVCAGMIKGTFPTREEVRTASR